MGKRTYQSDVRDVSDDEWAFVTPYLTLLGHLTVCGCSTGYWPGISHLPAQTSPTPAISLTSSPSPLLTVLDTSAHAPAPTRSPSHDKTPALSSPIRASAPAPPA